MLAVVFVVVVITTSYALAAFLRSRRPRAQGLPAPEGLFFVFLIPCLNEELVIDASLDRLLALPPDKVAVLVIDDGSDDRTAAVVAARESDRVWLVRRSRSSRCSTASHVSRAARGSCRSPFPGRRAH